MADKPHPGITMHKLPVGGGFIGALFAIGSALIFLIGFPTLWVFVALAFAMGIGVAVILKLISDHHSDRGKPLSILQPSQAEGRVPPDRTDRADLFRASPNCCSL